MAAQLSMWDEPAPTEEPDVEPEPAADRAPGEPFPLMSHQQRALEATLKGLTDYRSFLDVLPTGTGKTRLATEVVRRRKRDQVLFLAHRDEILQQSVDRLGGDTGEMVGLDQAQFFGGDERIVVGSIQTISKPTRLERFSPGRFDLVIVDEAHHSLAKTYRRVIDYFAKAKILGLSVGPESRLELRGGAFGCGWTGEVEAAYLLLLANGGRVTRVLGYDVIETGSAGVQSRGWTGTGFAWKTVKHFLRHPYEKSLTTIRAGGDDLALTDDHSVYRAEAGAGRARVLYGSTWQTKRLPVLSARPSSELRVGDILASDDGAGWDGAVERSLDVIALAHSLPINRRSLMHVQVDLSGVSSAQFKAWGIGPKQRWAHKRGKYGSCLPLDTFCRLRPHLPTPTRVYYEGGADGIWIDPTVRLSDWAYMFGFWLGDGWISERRIGFAVGDKEFDEVFPRIHSLPGAGWTVAVSRGKGKSSEVRCCNTLVVEILLSLFGGDIKCYEKFIPGEWMVSWPLTARRALLDGLMASDGCYWHGKGGRRGHVFTTTSLKLARDMLTLLRSLGIGAGIHTSKATEGGMVRGRRIVGRKPGYRVHWSGHAEDGDNRGHRGTRQAFYHGDLHFRESRIRRTAKLDSTPYVYDLEMDGHPSFVANGILVHNTATPDRKDEKAMSEVYDDFFVYDIEDAVADGVLCDLKIAPFHIHGLDLSSVKTNAKGDLNEDQLEAIVASEEVLLGYADVVLREAGQRKTVIFTPGVASAKGLAEIMNRHPSRDGCARSVDGKTESDLRRTTIRDHKNGRFQFLVNCGIVTEGYDDESIACIAQGRPTKSRSLSAQMIGRGLRKKKTGPFDDLLVIEFTGNAKPGFLSTPIDVLGGHHSDEEKELAQGFIEENPGMSARSALDKATAQMEREKKEQEEAARRAAIVAHAIYTKGGPINPFGVFHMNLEREIETAMRFGGKPISTKQINYLKWKGIPIPPGCNSKLAQRLIGTAIVREKYGKASFRDLQTLQQYGVNRVDISSVKAQEVLRAIDRNGKKPLSFAQLDSILCRQREPGE